MTKTFTDEELAAHDHEVARDAKMQLLRELQTDLKSRVDKALVIPASLYSTGLLTGYNEETQNLLSRLRKVED